MPLNIFLGLGLLSSCGSEVACTATFEVLTVEVIGADGKPVIDAATRTLPGATGEAFPVDA